MLTLYIFLAEIPGEYRDLLWGMPTVRLAVAFGFSRQFWTIFQLFIQYAAAVFALISGLVIFFRLVLPKNSREWAALLTSMTLVLLILIPLGEPEFVRSPLSFLEELRIKLYTVLITIQIIAFFNLLLIFPDNRFAPAWMRWAGLVLNIGVLFALLAGAIGLDQYGQAYAFFILPPVLLGIFGFASQIYRYRHVSNPLQRQQTKLILASLLLLPLYLILTLLAVFLEGQINAGIQLGLNLAIQVVLGILIPLTVTFSILRLHLWEIDLIIRRTLLYTALTATLLGIFFASVLALQTLFSTISHQQSPLAIVISTLAIAALFNPLRRRIQNDIDRRFYRQKYNAERIVADFAGKVRDEVILENMTEHLLGAVQETIHPETISIWFTHKRRN